MREKKLREKGMKNWLREDGGGENEGLWKRMIDRKEDKKEKEERIEKEKIGIWRVKV